MALNTCETWSNGIKIAFFSKTLRKIAQRLRLRPQTPICDTFELQYTSLPKHVSQFRHFRILTIGLSLLPWTNFLLRANTGPRLLIFHSTISLPPQKIPISKFLMPSLHVIFGLPPPPQSKILATPMSFYFVFVEYLCNRSPKIKTKNIAKYSSILAIVNHSPPLSYHSQKWK